MISWTVRGLRRAGVFEGIVVAVPAGWSERARRILGAGNHLKIVTGGRTRQDSVGNALKALPPACRLVAVHDAARPFASPSLIRRIVRAAHATGAAIPALPIEDTVKRVNVGGDVVATVPRETLTRVQTPQAARRDLLDRAHARARRRRVQATDESALLEGIGVRVRTVPGDAANIKITTPGDLKRAGRLLAARR